MVTKTALRMLEGTVLTDAKSETANNKSILRFTLSTGDSLDINMDDLLKNLGYLSSISKKQVTDALGYTPVNKAGDTMTGGLEVYPNGTSSNLSVEIGSIDSTNTPFIDFHSWTGGRNDYDARIYSKGGNATTGNGDLYVTASRILIPSGSVGAPGLTFSADPATDTGFYWNADGQIGVALSGQEGMIFKDKGIVANGEISGVSDRRLKTNIVTIPNPLKKIHALVGVTYDRTDSLTSEGKVWRQTGLIAQDVQAVLPEAVKENENGILSVAYGNLAGLAFEGIKEVDNKVEALTKALSSAMELINSLKEEVAKLKGI